MILKTGGNFLGLRGVSEFFAILLGLTRFSIVLPVGSGCLLLGSLVLGLRFGHELARLIFEVVLVSSLCRGHLPLGLSGWLEVSGAERGEDGFDYQGEFFS